MIEYAPLFEALLRTPAASWLETLPPQVSSALAPERHGRLPEWLASLEQLPKIVPSAATCTHAVKVGSPADLTGTQMAELETSLRHLQPWRKGPFDLFGIQIDTEWRSDWKWERLRDGIQPLAGRLVLDVGCGNGYHCWRMIGAGARLALGLDPFLLYVMQHWAIRHYVPQWPAYVLPLGIEALPPSLAAFDTVFSMGVLYHRRSPLDHLISLRNALRPGGELVLETLVIEGAEGQVLVPEDRYAKMRNVWFIPSVPTLANWLRKCRFGDIRILDVTATTTSEQRPTEWMPFQSLADFLDPADATRTVDGHPAPRRAILTAVAPG